MNVETAKYLDDEYVAACCFSFDFMKKQFKIAGAGISVFTYFKQGFYCIKEIIKGPFLGMLDNAEFDQKVVNFEKNNKFYLYSDGFEEFQEKKRVIDHYKILKTIKEQKSYIEGVIKSQTRLSDDLTWLGIEIN